MKRNHCYTAPCSLVINVWYYPKKETSQCLFTHPYKAGSNTWAWYLDILEALFVRHEVANCGNKVRTVSNSSQARHFKKHNQTKQKMESNTIRNTSFETPLLSPRFENVSNCHTFSSAWTPSCFAAKMLAMEKEGEFIPILYKPNTSLVLPHSLSPWTTKQVLKFQKKF